MKTVIVGPLLTADGANVSTDRVWAIPSREVRSVQPSVIPLRLGHGEPPAGRVTHLERAADGTLWCAGELDLDLGTLPDRDIYLSVEATFNAGTIGTDIEIRGAALALKSCMIGLKPATLLRDGLDRHGQASWRLSTFQQSLLKRGARYRKWSEPTIVHEEPPVIPVGGLVAAQLGQLEFRSAARVSVSGSGRTVEVIAAPYEQVATVEHRGRMVSEVISRGAFAGLDRRTDTIRVNRDHLIERTVGRATRFDTNDPRGLIAELRIAKTELGDETLALAGEDCLDCSIGFGVLAEQWQGTNLRRLNKVFLDHLALTPSPAYTAAKVISVRAGDAGPTPNLDRVLRARADAALASR